VGTGTLVIVGGVQNGGGDWSCGDPKAEPTDSDAVCVSSRAGAQPASALEPTLIKSIEQVTRRREWQWCCMLTRPRDKSGRFLKGTEQRTVEYVQPGTAFNNPEAAADAQPSTVDMNDNQGSVVQNNSTAMSDAQRSTSSVVPFTSGTQPEDEFSSDHLKL
jgi:hypothetical protein